MDRETRNILNSKQASLHSTMQPSVGGMLDGQIVVGDGSNRQPSLALKKHGKVYKMSLSADGNQYVDKNLKVIGNAVIKKRTGIGVAFPEGSLSISSGYHKIAIE